MKLTKPLIAVAVAAGLALAAGAGIAQDRKGPPDGGPHGKMEQCKRPGGSGGPGGDHKRFGGGDHKPSFQMTMASRLAAMETEIGIRAEQLDTWRDFTDAMLAMMQPPAPPAPDAAPNPDEKPEAFSMAEGFADRAIERADKAEALKKAIAALRETLTPEQLAKVQAHEARMHGPHGGFHGGFGPGQGGPGKKGPCMMGHGKGPGMGSGMGSGMGHGKGPGMGYGKGPGMGQGMGQGPQGGPAPADSGPDGASE
ncbi:Spy/CpxP family protein refolding chaperone [Methyloligella sp. 2.7D]|uniref:Spy/CpxP family protein refolding chaperone n=1 Tax=unclassified Methyloligella TaxID=2625955 RepID=UPI001ABB447C|nr:Spy/CpxP family protein refolding chaperone [Methyloligella sp. GL2]